MPFFLLECRQTFMNKEAKLITNEEGTNPKNETFYRQVRYS